MSSKKKKKFAGSESGKRDEQYGLHIVAHYRG